MVNVGKKGRMTRIDPRKLLDSRYQYCSSQNGVTVVTQTLLFLNHNRIRLLVDKHRSEMHGIKKTLPYQLRYSSPLEQKSLHLLMFSTTDESLVNNTVNTIACSGIQRRRC